jgi:hypothetical protein
VRKRGGRKRALGTRAPMVISQDRNLRWSLDFVADTLVSGRRFRILTLVDDFTRECLGLVVDASLTGLRVARELDRIAEQRRYPCMIVSDNGTELTSNAILGMAAGARRQMALHRGETGGVIKLGVHLSLAAKLSRKPGPPRFRLCPSVGRAANSVGVSPLRLECGRRPFRPKLLKRLSNKQRSCTTGVCSRSGSRGAECESIALTNSTS